MTRELIGDFPAANDREQMGRLLRYSFPLRLGTFPELLKGLGEQRLKAPTRH
jgi:hypothetical protein